MKKRLLLIPLLLGLLTGCDPLTPPDPGEKHVESITLSETEKTLEVGSFFELNYTINPEDATNQSVTWETSDSSIASVSDGVVVANGVGTANITVKTVDQEKTATCSVTVTEKLIHVTSVKLNKSVFVLEVGEEETLFATVLPTNATNKTLTWNSSNPACASVSNGKVTALSAGTASITATSVDENITAVCMLQVFEPEEITRVTSVSLNKTSLTMNVNQTEELIASVLPSDATEKTVLWQVEDDSVVSLIESEDGKTVKALKEGSTVVTVSTVDGNFIASCEITVTGTVDPEEETKTFFFDPLEDSQFEKKTNVDITSASFTRDAFTFEFAQNTAQNKPIYTYTNGSGTHKAGGSFRLYPGSSMKISSAKPITEIVFTYYEYKDTPTNSLTSDVGSFTTDTWKGESGAITFTAGGESGARAIQTIEITYIDKTITPDPIDLGVKTIKEVKEYIAENPVTVNSHQCGVNEAITVTIKGLAMAKISLIKTAKAFGLNVSEPSKIIIGDSTDCIGVATKTGDGTLFNKVGDNQMKDTSFYEVTGYISTYLGQPEIVCTEFTWLKGETLPYNVSKMSKADVTIPEFYQKAADVNYNCAGHGYGDVVTLKCLTCYYEETDGQGKAYYNFTDGTQNIRVNTFNIGRASVGSVYDVTGVISLLNLSPIIVAFEMKKSTENPVDLQGFYKNATTLSITNLRAIHGSQDDTDTRYPDVVKSYAQISKVEGYLCVVEENGKLYVGVSDTYKGKEFIVGKDNAKANYNVALIKNDNFWNTTEEQLALFNPYYTDYLCEDEKVTLYYVNRQLGYKQNKAMWEILLIPQSIPVIEK